LNQKAYDAKDDEPTTPKSLVALAGGGVLMQLALGAVYAWSVFRGSVDGVAIATGQKTTLVRQEISKE
jgi:hypothetical protein